MKRCGTMHYLGVHLVLVHELLQDPLSVLRIFRLGFRQRRGGSRRLPARRLLRPGLLGAALIPRPLASALGLGTGYRCSQGV